MQEWVLPSWFSLSASHTDILNSSQVKTTPETAAHLISAGRVSSVLSILLSDVCKDQSIISAEEMSHMPFPVFRPSGALLHYHFSKSRCAGHQKLGSQQKRL